jgi:predicted amidohydrolase YtcJ
MAINGDTITLVGTTAEVQKLTGENTQIIDAKGQFVTPGFIDSHVHFIDGGFRWLLYSCGMPVHLKSLSAACRFYQIGSPRHLDYRRRWDHTNWGNKLPQSHWIDSVTTQHPVFIQRLDGHMALANSLAMQEAKVSASTKEITGGTIVRDAKGKPTGIFKDNAMALFDNIVTDPLVELKDRALEAAMQYVAEQGVTSVHNMGTWDDLATFKRAHRKGKLTSRIYAAVPLSIWDQLRDTVTRYG